MAWRKRVEEQLSEKRYLMANGAEQLLKRGKIGDNRQPERRRISMAVAPLERRRLNRRRRDIRRRGRRRPLVNDCGARGASSASACRVTSGAGWLIGGGGSGAQPSPQSRGSAAKRRAAENGKLAAQKQNLR